MSFFVDTNVIIYSAIDADERRRDACRAILRAIADGAPGSISAVVLQELWHLELSGRLHESRGLARWAAIAMGEVLPVTRSTMDIAFEVQVDGLGAADRIHVASCIENGLQAIVSADRGFDGSQVRRIDPLDREALGAIGLASG